MPRFSNLKVIGVQKAAQLMAIVGSCLVLGALFGCYTAVGNFDPLLPGSQHEAITYPSANESTTYDDVTNFLAKDTTDGEEYREGFNCVDFAMEVMRAATWYGIECSVMALISDDEINHTVVAFPTENNGWVFVEPQSDEVIEIYPGMIYAGSVIKRIDRLAFKWVVFEDWSE